MSTPTNYQRASIETANDLKHVAKSKAVQDLSRLTLPEIDAVVDLTAQIMPAGNVPGMILNGLARMPGQRPPARTVQQHIHALFDSVDKLFNQVAYGTVFVGPAAVIWGYQNLLKLVGKDPEASFPEGTWQFYAGYALREDTARHMAETHGFDTVLKQHNIELTRVDRITAWVMACISTIHQYHAHLENEWRERVATSLLREVTQHLPDASQYERIYREWELERPYRRTAEAATYDYPVFRRLKFERFLAKATANLPAEIRAGWNAKMGEALEESLPAYQQQMSILAYLDPGPYGETRVPYGIEQAHAGLIYQGNYYLFPVCEPGSTAPADVGHIRAQIATLAAATPPPPANLASLARIRRASLAEIRPRLTPDVVAALNLLRFAPILFNADPRPAALPLTSLRQTERGVGDHPLTIFNTDKTFVFDQSHIFFDGMLGAALAEIITNEALSWAAYLSSLPPIRSTTKLTCSWLNFHFDDATRGMIKQLPKVTPEAVAESSRINLPLCANLRRLFKQRNSRLQLTVNDLLVLYRAIHAVTYKPSPELLEEIAALEKANPPQSALAASIRQALEETSRTNPSMLIPVDASRRIPRDRVYPLSIDVPLTELGLLEQHQKVLQALNEYENNIGTVSPSLADFDELQRTYLATLAGFGSILNRWKEIAIQGESASVGAIKLLANLPPVVQQLMNKVPERFEMLNNVLKGREVFSNVGMVVPGSSLTRFVTAKDDNEQKQFAWGIITDANGVMHVNLRDFRPHVAALQAIGRESLANHITQDYLNAYVDGFNRYMRDLQRITIASRKTRLFNQKAQP